MHIYGTYMYNIGVNTIVYFRVPPHDSFVPFYRQKLLKWGFGQYQYEPVPFLDINVEVFFYVYSELFCNEMCLIVQCVITSNIPYHISSLINAKSSENALPRVISNFWRELQPLTTLDLNNVNSNVFVYIKFFDKTSISSFAKVIGYSQATSECSKHHVQFQFFSLFIGLSN